MERDVVLIKRYEKQVSLFDREINLVVTYVDNGVTVLLTGGDLSHFGATSIMDEAGNLTSQCFEGHKEGAIADKWAKSLFDKYKKPILVSVGIHYDDASKKQIDEIVMLTDELLEELLLKND